MNLIEQLGGYEKAKGWIEVNAIDVDWLQLGKYRKELLEYRREHNIFEVGDKVVIINHPHGSSSIHSVCEPINETSVGIAPIHRDGEIMHMLGQLASPHYLRHATDAEIKAGKRLEVS